MYKIFAIIGLFGLMIQQSYSACFKLGTKPAEPFIIVKEGVDDGNYPKQINQSDITGYTADIWTNIKKQLVTDYTCFEYYLYQSNNDGFTAIQDGNITAFAAASTITEDRLELVDFIEHYRRNELAIVVNADVNNVETILTVFRAIFSAQFMLYILIFTALIVALGYIVFLSDQICRDKHQSLFRDDAQRGVPKALLWTFLATAIKEVREPKTICSVIMLIFLTVFGVMVMGVVLGAAVHLTENTSESLEIGGFSDLNSKTVGTVINTQPYQYLIENLHSANIIAYDSIEEMFENFINGNTDAAIYDAPIMIYRQAQDSAFKETRIVGNDLDISDMGIAFGNDNNVVQEQLDKIMRNLRQTGVINELRVLWFTSAETDLNAETDLRSAFILLGVIAGITIVLGIFTHCYVKYKEIQRMKKLEKRGNTDKEHAESLYNDMLSALSRDARYKAGQVLIDKEDEEETELEALRYQDPEEVAFRNRRDLIKLTEWISNMYTIITDIGKHRQIQQNKEDDEERQSLLKQSSIRGYPDDESKDDDIELAYHNNSIPITSLTSAPVPPPNYSSSHPNQSQGIVQTYINATAPVSTPAPLPKTNGYPPSGQNGYPTNNGGGYPL